MNCKNCGQVVSGNYCSHCGQSTKVDRINYANLLSELSDSIFQINKGLFFTLKELLWRPGSSIRAYINGKRKNYFKPIAYVLTLSTIYYLTTQLLGSNTTVADFLEGYSNLSGITESDMERIAFLNWFAENFAYTTLLLLPISAVASFGAFRKAGLNYLEHFVLNAYITGQHAFFYFLSTLISLGIRQEDFLASFTLLLNMVYTFFVLRQFFPKYKLSGFLFRFILTYLFYLIQLGIVVSVFSLILS